MKLDSIVLHDLVDVVLKAISKRNLVEHLMNLLNVLTEVACLHQLAIGSGPLEPTLIYRRKTVLVNN